MPRKRRSPLWAKLLVATGAVLLLTSGTALAGANFAMRELDSAIDQQSLFGDQDEEADYGGDITGPVTMLLTGLDTRPSRPHEPPLADSIILVHVPASLDRAYLISIPRDTIVDIPAFEATHYYGGRGRINSAMSYGSQQQMGEELPNVPRGFDLLSRTIAQLTGVDRFDAGAVINFVGFTDIVDALGGISVTLEGRIVSEHRQPDGKHRPLNPGGNGYYGPQMVYEPGMHPCGPATADGSFTCELNGWQALDVSRQRYGVEGSDYGRQRNQQLVLRAMLDKAFSRDIVTNPMALRDVLGAAEGALTFDGRGNDPIDFAFALRNIRPSNLVMVRLEAVNVGTGSAYQGEELTEQSRQLLQALGQGRLEDFLIDNPQFLD